MQMKGLIYVCMILAMTTARQYQDNDNDTLFISSKYHDVTVNHSIFIMNSAYNSKPLK